MKIIPFNRRKFPAASGLNGGINLPFSATALVRAVIAAGINPSRKPRTSPAKFGIAARVATLKSALNMSGPAVLRPTREFMRAGVTDKGNQSFFIGNALCAHAAESVFNIPWLVDVENMGGRYTVAPALTGKRPDFLGRALNGNWYVLESKGQSHRPGRAKIKKWKKQARAVRHVNGNQVVYNIISAAFLNRDEYWELLWVDPPADKDASDVNFDDDSFFAAYYGEIYSFIQERIESAQWSNLGPLVPVGDTGISMGLHKEVWQAFKNRNWQGIIGFARTRIGDDAKEIELVEEFAKPVDDGISIFPDGVIIKLGTDGDKKIKTLSPTVSAILSVKREQNNIFMTTPANTIGQRERITQNRVIKLFREQLEYAYLGNWEERPDNRNIEPELLKAFLRRRDYSETVITKALLQVEKAAGNLGETLYHRNRAFYEMLRYGVKVTPEAGEKKVTVWLVDWDEAENNDFAIAEEVTVNRANAQASDKRPDIVVYVNGLALGVLELKRSSVSVEEGIRQNLDNQKKEFIEPFFSTMQFVMAGNDTQGMRFGTIQTPEKYYLTWKEEDPDWTPKLGLELKYLKRERYPAATSDLDMSLLQIMPKKRFLDLIHNFIVFDSGIKKVCRHNQFFATHACQKFVNRREGGIVWNTQGSGKSLIMVWLAKWIREHVTDPRVLIITDRNELDEQIEKVFLGVQETIYRTDSGADLIAQLNAAEPWLICSLIHKFGTHIVGDEDERAVTEFIQKMKQALPKGFRAKGSLFVFVDECHRTQSGKLHEAMKEILPGAVFIGFTGTPLLKADKATTLEVFGSYIHTYKFDEGVQDKVILDLRYEARDIDQHITSQTKIDQWFEAKTRGLTNLAKAQLKQRWGTLRKVLSSQSRLEKIVADILMDMETKDRLKSGRGNAMLVSGSIYSACKFYDLFQKTDLKGKCAIVTSYAPTPQDIKGQESGEGLNEKLRQYDIYRKMLAEHFREPEDAAAGKVEQFEVEVKKSFIDEPGQMKLLIVVNKLLTGFDAPSATYLYIDQTMENHGLFQAICRVNRLDGNDKDYGYIIDYKDLFKSVNQAIKDYTIGPLAGYDKKDVEGLLKDRVKTARQHLEDTLEAVRALCEPVPSPRDQAAYLHYFSSKESGNADQLKESEPRRLSLYQAAAALMRAYADIANEMAEAGFNEAETQTIKKDVTLYESLRSEVKLHSGDAIDLKRYEPAMRHLIDTYIRADDSEKISDLENLSLLELIVQRGAAAVDALPKGLRENKTAVAETIENNVRRLIIDEQPINPRYYDRMSQLLDALIRERRQGSLDYKKYLQRIAELTKQVKNPLVGSAYPPSLNSRGKQALYDNLDHNESLALAVDVAVRAKSQDDWRNHLVKTKIVRNAIKATLPVGASNVDTILELVKNQNEY